MSGPNGALYLLQLFVSAFLAILFLQSGIDKIVDRQGNLEWLKDHFAKSPLAGMVPLMFLLLTIIEVSAGAVSGIGFLALIFSHNSTYPLFVPTLFTISTLFLFSSPRL